MAAAGRVVVDTIALLGEHIRPGVTTGELDRLAADYIASQGGTSPFMGYRGYPASICTSPNAMVVHGIPGPLALDGGRHPLGRRRSDPRRLRGRLRLHASRRRDLSRGTAPARGLPGRARGRHRAMPPGQPPFRHLARSSDRDRGGRATRSSAASWGTGSAAPCTRTRRSRTTARRAGARAGAGMTFAVEPMITAGSAEVVVHDDQWSISTVDKSLSAHFEHTVAVTEEGPRILTAAGRPGERVCYHNRLRAACLRVFPCPGNRAHEARFRRRKR